MRIYSKTGDAGSTGLIGGARVPKNSARIAAIGDVDELNAALGWAATVAEALLEEIQMIQRRLFELGACLAKEDAAFPSEPAGVLERSIDRQTLALPELRSFILPGGTELSARLHLARTICRRAERSLWQLNAESPISGDAMVFLNRLSDWLFVAARTANATQHVPDIEWHSE